MAIAPGLGARPSRSQAAQPTDAALQAYIDGIVQDAMASEHIAGAAVAIVRRDKVAVVRGYGLAKLEPMAPVDPARTLFRVGSITKTFTWIEVMKAVERGDLALDVPVNRYLPQRLQLPDEGFRRAITLRHLLSHSAGFADSELGHLIVDRPDRLMPFDQYLAHHRPQRVREAGEKASYSNYGAALAGYIAARQARLTYPALIERDIAAPLGLQGGMTIREPYPARANLAAPAAPQLAMRFADGFAWNGSRFTTQPTEFLTNSAPSGSASMSAAAAAHYMRLLLRDGKIDGRQVYGPAAARAFRTPILSAPVGTNGWAHGFSVSLMPNGSTGYGHGGSTVYMQSSLIVIPELDLGIFVATNSASGWALTRRLPRLVVSWLTGRGERAIERRGDPALVAKSDDFAGPYRSTRRPYRGLEAFADALGGTSHIDVSADGRLVTRNGPLTQSWVPTGVPGEFINTTSEERLRFDLDRHGRATGVAFPTGTGYLERSSAVFERATFDRLGWATLLVAAAAWAVSAIRRKAAATAGQRLSQRMLLVASGAWLAAAMAFREWLPAASDPRIMFDFPGPWLPTASGAALVAALASVATVVLLPLAWRTASEPGWPIWQRAAHSIAALAFIAFAALLLAWHALDLFA